MRPTKFNPEISARIIARLRKGYTIRAVCQAENISRRTYYGWLELGSMDGEEYAAHREFLRACTEAIGLHAIDMEAVIMDRAKEDPEYAKFVLKTRWYKDWSEHYRTERAKDREALKVLLGRIEGLERRLEVAGENG